MPRTRGETMVAIERRLYAWWPRKTPRTDPHRAHRAKTKQGTREIAPKVHRVRWTPGKTSGNRTHGGYSARRKNKRVIKLRASKDVRRDLRTSYRALSTEKGFNAKPAATRVVAPARRFPGPVSTGSTEEDCLSGSRFWTAEKRGDVAMKPRN